MSNRVTIYVLLLNEGIDVWRPVQAEHLHGNIYRIMAQQYDRTTELWQFEPGDVVLCEPHSVRRSADGCDQKSNGGFNSEAQHRVRR